jgi:tRNA1(Val) A37 N6-methylase TrmN6
MPDSAEFAPEELGEDHFLGGRLALLQPRVGYRAATDPVLLAAAAPVAPGQSVLDLGCGAGAAALCLGVRVPGVLLAGLEVQATYAALARTNAERNRLAFDVTLGDVAALPANLRAQSFDHVIANPPYYAPQSPAAADKGRDSALRESAPASLWVDAGLRRLRSGGALTMIHLAERLPALLGALEGRASATVLPLCPRAGRTATRVIVQMRKGGRAPFRLLAPLVIHDGERHDGDRDSFTPEVQAILRDGARLTRFDQPVS